MQQKLVLAAVFLLSIFLSGCVNSSQSEAGVKTELVYICPNGYTVSNPVDCPASNPVDCPKLDRVYVCYDGNTVADQKLCPQPTPSPIPSVEAPVSECGIDITKKLVLKENIERVLSLGKVTAILCTDSQLTISYVSYFSYAGVDTLSFEEMQKIALSLVSSFILSEKPVKVVLRTELPDEKPGVYSRYATTFTWEQLKAMANLDFTLAQWREVTDVVTPSVQPTSTPKPI